MPLSGLSPQRPRPLPLPLYKRKGNMNITVIGASAGIGLETVNLALANGHQVTTLSRTTQTLPDSARLTKVKGSATSVADVKQAISKADVILVTIGKKGKSPGNETLFADTANALIQAVSGLEVAPPIVAVTGFGAGESGQYQSLLMRALFRLFLKQEYDDKTYLETLLTNSELPWEIVRPGRLTNKPATGHYRALPKLEKGMTIGAVSRKDVADFLVKQAENPTMLRRYVSLTD